ncbi:MAG: hypothetical protein KA440_11495 [Azonexus sp.]|nr:hypothetical protein [Azonexus sp.]
MKNIRLHLIALLLCATASAQSQTVSDGEIKASFDRLPGELRGKANFVVVETGRSNSAASGQVSISKAELNALLDGASAESRSVAIDLLIAHELWHQRQFLLYGTAILQDPDGAATRLYECHADLLASHTIVTAQPKLDKNAFIRLKAAVTMAALSGVTVHAGSSHGSPWQRQRAIQYGLSAAMLNGGRLSSFREVLREIGAPREFTDGAPTEADLALVMRRFLDYPEGISLEEWGLRVCSQIVHYESEAIQKITVGRAAINWKKNPDTPVVSYSIPYTNISDRIIKMSGALQTILISRKAPQDVSKQMVFSVQPLNINIAPGATAIVNGSLPWWGDEDFYPRLAYDPNGEHSMIAAQFTESTGSPSNGYCMGSRGAEVSSFAASLRRPLERLAGSASSQFLDFRLGAATNSDDETVTYRSSEKIPGDPDTIIEVENSGASSVLAVVYRGASEEEARNIYKKYRDAVVSICPPVGAKLVESQRNGFPHLRARMSARSQLELDARKSKYSENYNVEVTLRAMNW